MEDYFRRATNPKQYDEGALDWKTEGSKESPMRKFFHEYLTPELAVRGKTVLDIGSGLGPLFPVLKGLGAKKIVGIEPSQQNVEATRALYPDVLVHPTTLADAEMKEPVDAATAVMVFEHIGDIDEAFAKIEHLLNPGGRFYLVVSNSEYYVTPRFDYTITTEKVDESTTAVKVFRPHDGGTGTMYDLVRTPQTYLDAAQRTGFSLVKHVPMKPTEGLVQAAPKYGQFRDTPITHLFVFQKPESPVS